MVARRDHRARVRLAPPSEPAELSESAGTLRRAERERIVGRHLCELLRKECEGIRGRQAEIARKTGFRPSQISIVLSDSKHTIGERLGRALARLWTLEYDTLLESVDQYGEVRLPKSDAPERLPNLRATLEWCRGETFPGQGFPDAFLRGYERDVRASADADRPRLSWLSDLQSVFWSWKRTEGERLDTGVPGDRKARKSSDGARAKRRKLSAPEPSGTFQKVRGKRAREESRDESDKDRGERSA